MTHIMMTLATLFSKPLGIFTINETPKGLATRLQKVNDQPFLPNPNEFPKSYMVQSTDTNALYQISLGDCKAYVNLYRIAGKPDQTEVKIDLSRIHGETLFWTMLYLLIMGACVLVGTHSVETITSYVALVIITFYLYHIVTKNQRTDLLILLNDLFPEPITQKRKGFRWSILRPTTFQFMSSKSLDYLPYLMKSIYQLDTDKRYVELRQQSLDATAHEAVIQIKRYGRQSGVWVAASLSAKLTNDNELLISGTIYRKHLKHVISGLFISSNFGLVVFLATANLGGAFVLGAILISVMLIGERIHLHFQNDVEDLTDFIYQKLA